MKANASEPLMKGRYHVRRCRNRGYAMSFGTSAGRDLFGTGMTSGL